MSERRDQWGETAEERHARILTRDLAWMTYAEACARDGVPRSERDHLIFNDGYAAIPEPSAEGYAEFENWEQEMFRHQPVLSMHDGSIAGCQCLDRVFVKGEDWGTHLATVITGRITGQGEPSDAQVTAGADELWRQLTRVGTAAGPTYAICEQVLRVALRAANGAR